MCFGVFGVLFPFFTFFTLVLNPLTPLLQLHVASSNHLDSDDGSKGRGEEEGEEEEEGKEEEKINEEWSFLFTFVVIVIAVGSVASCRLHVTVL